MYKNNYLLILFLSFSVMVSCSRSVSVESVYGTYLASYPFGKEILILNRDGTFIQEVSINGEKTEKTTGSWHINNDDLILMGNYIVSDGSEKYNKKWRAIEPGICVYSVERIWFKITINSASSYPFIKQ